MAGGAAGHHLGGSQLPTPRNLGSGWQQQIQRACQLSLHPWVHAGWYAVTATGCSHRPCLPVGAVPRAERLPDPVPGVPQAVGQVQHAAIALVVAGLRWLSSHVLMDGGGPACLRAARCAAWFAQQTRRCGTWPPPAESSSRSDNFYEVDVPVKGHRSLQGAPVGAAALACLLLCTEHGRSACLQAKRSALRHAFTVAC